MGMVDRHINNTSGVASTTTTTATMTTTTATSSTMDGGEELRVASSLVGTPDYVAPEIILNQNHTFAVDYWSLGVMIYEFLMGYPPFHGETERDTHRNILVGHVTFDKTVAISDDAIDLIKKLLVIEPHRRLGFSDINEIIWHPWFGGLNPLKDEPPFKPELSNKFDTGYFEQRYEFDGNEDASILIDLQQCITPTYAFPDEDISAFPSVAIDQLGNANREIAEKIEHKRTQSLSQEELLDIQQPQQQQEMQQGEKLKTSTSFNVVKKQKKHRKHRHHSFFRTNSSSRMDMDPRSVIISTDSGKQSDSH